MYAKDGNIFARKDEKTRYNKINTMDDVDKMLLSASGVRTRSNRAAVVRRDASDEDDEDENNFFQSPN